MQGAFGVSHSPRLEWALERTQTDRFPCPSFSHPPLFSLSLPKGHSLSDGLDEVQKAEMKAYMELVNNMLLTAEVWQNTSNLSVL